MMKRVTFSDSIKIQHTYVWDFAYREARKSDWQFAAIDRLRFKRRIMDMGLVLNHILEEEHRQKMFESRFAKL